LQSRNNRDRSTLLILEKPHAGRDLLGPSYSTLCLVEFSFYF